MSRVLAASLALAAWLAAAHTPARAESASPETPQPGAQTQAGELFGQPVSMSNYLFAKRVALMFPTPWGAADLPAHEQQRRIWEALLLHYQAYRRGITVTPEEEAALIQQLLDGTQSGVNRQQDPAAYADWVTRTLQEPVELFENQVRYLLQIQKLKDQVRTEQQVSATEEEMQQEFLNERHHVGGDMAVFDTRDAALAFYEAHRTSEQWEAMKATGNPPVRTVGLMTLEAYMDLWGIPKDQMYAFHALEIGSVGSPMPFGKQWCVYRLLEKRTGDLADFPAERENYRKQVEMKKRYEALQRWIAAMKAASNLRIDVREDASPPPPAATGAAAAE